MWRSQVSVSLYMPSLPLIWPQSRTRNRSRSHAASLLDAFVLKTQIWKAYCVHPDYILLSSLIKCNIDPCALYQNNVPPAWTSTKANGKKVKILHIIQKRNYSAESAWCSELRFLQQKEFVPQELFRENDIF